MFQKRNKNPSSTGARNKCIPIIVADKGSGDVKAVPAASSSSTASYTNASNDSVADDGSNNVIVTKNEHGTFSFFRSDSSQLFVPPPPISQEVSSSETSASNSILTPAEVNQRLNLNLGLKWMNPNNKTLLFILRFLNNLLVAWWEKIPLFIYEKCIPLAFKRAIIHLMWKIYLPIHKFLFAKRTGIHRSLSYEYHALTTAIYWTRFFPLSIDRCRWACSQFNVYHPVPLTSRFQTIREPFYVHNPPRAQRDACRVRGVYMHVSDEPTEYVLFWVFGGAFVAGSADSNAGPAEAVGKTVNTDVFLVSHRQIPEVTIEEIIWDVFLAYKWLCQHRDPSRIILLGISSGAGLCLLIQQAIAAHKRNPEAEMVPSFLPKLVVDTQPAGSVLICPFANLTQSGIDDDGTFIQYSQHDLVVHPRVLDSLIPFLETHGHGRNDKYSAVYQSFEGISPLCVVSSQHEATYAQTLEVVNKARAAGVKVTFGLWQYLCHAFPLFYPFVPEAQQAMDFICSWIQSQQQLEKL